MNGNIEKKVIKLLVKKIQVKETYYNVFEEYKVRLQAFIQIAHPT